MATDVVSIVTTKRGVREAERVAARPARLIVFLLIPVFLLSVIGLGAILSASSVLGLRESGDGLFYFKRQIVWLGLGTVALVGSSLIPLGWWRRLALPLFVGTVVLLGATMLIGTRAYGSQRWIFVGPISIQPSEIAKLTTILFLAMLVSRHEHVMYRFRDLVWPVGASVGIVAAFVITQPDLGTTLLISFGAFAVLVASAAPFRHVMMGGALATGVAFVAARTSPYRWARVTSFLDLTADPLGGGYQAVQSLVALGTGGVFGVGLGASRARWSFLPNAHTDFVLSIIGEETGLAGSLAVVGLLVALTIAGGAVAYHARDRFGRLVAIGITTWLMTQALVNMGGVTGVLPITGVPLTFVSFGGSALVAAMVGVGVLISVARDGARS